MSNFNDVQEAAKRRAASTMSSEQMARQIVATAQGDVRLAYELLDVLNAHVTRLLRGGSDG
jgi:replication-associated recombination protein RarA